MLDVFLATEIDPGSNVSNLLKLKSAAQPLKLKCAVQHYHWGIPGQVGLVGRLSGESQGRPCAELWLGAHPSLSSMIEHGKNEDAKGERCLNKFIEQNSESCLGSVVLERFGTSLPFLFKILSIAKPLSIQAHPDKALAERLFRDKSYPDDNHKPELAVALKSLTLLYGFRPLSELREHFRRLPILETVFGLKVGALDQVVGPTKVAPKRMVPKQIAALRRTFSTRIFSHSDAEIEKLSKELAVQIAALNSKAPEDLWVLKLLTEDYPKGDVGLFLFYGMNLVQLSEGEALFIGPNIAHAYLQGELVECMANSDNVVRAGLTPKDKDVETLLSMLDYFVERPEIIRPMPPADDEYEFVYQPKAEVAAEEFLLSEFMPTEDVRVVENKSSPEVMFCLEGVVHLLSADKRYMLEAGEALFIPAAVSSYEIHDLSGRLFRVRVP